MQRKGERESSRELQHKSRDSTAGPSEVLSPFLNQLWWPGDEDVLTGLSWAPGSMPGAESASLGAQGLEVGEGVLCPRCATSDTFSPLAGILCRQ